MTADITAGDRVIFNAETYGVKGVSTYNFGKLQHKKIALEKL